MPELVRSVIAELYRIVGTKSVPAKRTVQLPVAISLVNQQSNARGNNNSIFGFTRDVSKTGISFIVSSIKLGEKHLFYDDAPSLEIRIKLPEGIVTMTATTVRYDVSEDGLGFLVAARIVGMSEEDRAYYYNFLRTPLHKLVSSPQVDT
jgi:hypothetical protein